MNASREQATTHQPARRRTASPSVESLIRQLREQIETGTHMPGSRVFVDEDLFLRTLDDLRVAYVQAVQEARWVLEQRHTLLSEAEAEAEDLIAVAQRNAQAMLTDVGVKAAAEERAEEIVQAADTQAEGTRESAWRYALDELTTLDESVQKVADALRDARRHLPLDVEHHAPAPQPLVTKPAPTREEQEVDNLAWNSPARRRARRARR